MVRIVKGSTTHSPRGALLRSVPPQLLEPDDPMTERRAPTVPYGLLLSGALLALMLNVAALAGFGFKAAQWSQRVDDREDRIIQQVDALERRVHDLEVIRR